MRVSPNGVRLIAAFEGGQSSDGLFHPYRDPVGVWTIGYGHTEGVGSSSRPLTRRQAEDLLQRDLDRKYAPAVDRYSWARLLNQNQYDALVSFVYNLGPGYIAQGHDMGDALARHDWKGAARAFGLYVKAGGGTLPGLVRRREAERRLFETSPAPSPLTPNQRKIVKWQAELDRIRAYVKRKGDGWARHPIRWARAKRLKAAIARHGGKPK